MTASDVKTIRESAGFVVRNDLATLEVTGPDRVRYLNGMLSNDVTLIGVGEGQMAVKPSNRGRVEAVLRVRNLGPKFQLDMQASRAKTAAAILEKFIIMDDCTLSDITESRAVITVVGPGARGVLARADLDAGPLDDLGFVAIEGATVVKDRWLGLDGYDLLVAADGVEDVTQRLTSAGASPISAEALDVARIEAGQPKDGVDIDDDTIPLEARLDAALNFEKGCYIGQEVIARAHNLGGVKHILVGLQTAGEVAAQVGAEIFVPGADRKTGDITSSALSPTLGHPIALGYVRTADQEPGTKVEIRQAGQEPLQALIVQLPFVAG